MSMHRIRLAQGVTCTLCGKEAVVLCDGCDKPLCKDCRVFDIWCHGCGTGDVHVFCRECFNNPEINIWKGW